MSDQTPEPKLPRAYEREVTNRTAETILNRLVADQNLRRWCVDCALKYPDPNRTVGIVASEILGFVTASSIEVLKAIGYIVPKGESP